MKHWCVFLAACAAAPVVDDDDALIATTVDEMRYRQELTVVIDGTDRPLNLAKKLAERVGGEVELEDESLPNGRAVVVTDAGKWFVSLDGEVPTIGAVVEVRTPRLFDTEEAADQLAAMLDAMATVGTIMPEYGGGHLSLDGDRFLANPAFLSRMLLVYLDAEAELVATYRHPVRQGNAIAFQERYYAELAEVRADFAAFADLPPEQLEAAISAFISKWSLRREMAMNIQKLAGVLGGNKKSKGLFELRLFNAPRTRDDIREQRRVVRKLLEAAW